MFTVDIPYPPQQADSVLVAQSNVTTKPPQSAKSAPTKPPKSPKIDYVLTSCEEYNDIPEESERAGYYTSQVSPEVAFATYFDARRKSEVDLSALRITLLEEPKHGDFYVTPKLGPGGNDYYSYFPKVGYFGRDKAVFLAQYAGKTYKIVMTLQVQASNVEARGLKYPQPCFDSRLIKVGSATLPALDYKVALNFTNLPGTAVGETVGTGNTATITLDTNAAGHGWFIDATPGDNSEYLATSDANVWIAKPGSAADGKMDMLSVLLHEYGHALGFERSADTSDFMSASLVAGERRLPTADELTLMSQLIAKLKGSDGTTSPSSPSAPSSPFDPSAPLGKVHKWGLHKWGLHKWGLHKWGQTPLTELNNGV